MEFPFLWDMSPCCLAADVSNEPTVSVICVHDQGTVTVVTASFCASLHAITNLPSHHHSKLQERCPCHGSGLSRRTLIAEARDRLQSSLCDFCGRQRRTGISYSPSTSVFPCHAIALHPHLFHLISK
jgi:hypothetical protein